MGKRADSGSGIDLRTREPGQAQAIMGDRFARHTLRVLDRKRSLDFSLRQEELGQVAFLQVSYGREVEVATSGVRDFYLVQLTLAGVCETSVEGGRATETGAGWIHVVNPGAAYLKRWSSDATQLIVRLPRRSIQRLATADADEQPVVFDQRAEPAPAALSNLLQFFWSDATTAQRARNAVIDRSAGGHIMTAVLHSLPNTAAAVTVPGEVPACLSRADRYIRQNLAREIRLGDLAQAAGVGIRSLESAFRTYWRSTPTAHIRSLRLETAHHLLTHPAGGMSVTEAATAAGFPHLGRFSRRYAQQFGELPSESLRRATTPETSLSPTQVSGQKRR